MAKKPSTSGSKADRRAVVEQLRKEQERKEKRRTYAIVGGCVAVALVIVGLGAYPLIRDARESARFADTELAAIGTPKADASCQDVITAPAEGSAQHVPDGTTVEYTSAPPAFGEHYAAPAVMSRKFYTAEDRPRLETLVHNLEHGYNILWYDESLADDAESVAELRAIADKFPGTDDFRNKFIVAPWTSDDGEPFPDGATMAMTHWSVSGEGDEANEDGQQGVWQYCGELSGEAVAEFVEAYPFTDSPEPNAF